jgi:hypothetical protein
MDNLTANQKKILGFLKNDGVAIQCFNNKYALTKFGLNAGFMSKNTFEALLPHLKTKEVKPGLIIYILK